MAFYFINIYYLQVQIFWKYTLKYMYFKIYSTLQVNIEDT